MDPAVVWNKLSGQFQRKGGLTNSLSGRSCSPCTKLSDSGSMSKYIKNMMTEISDEVAVIAERISDEDEVVYIPACRAIRKLKCIGECPGEWVRHCNSPGNDDRTFARRRTETEW